MGSGSHCFLRRQKMKTSRFILLALFGIIAASTSQNLHATGFGISAKLGLMVGGLPTAGAEASLRFPKLGLFASYNHGEYDAKDSAQSEADNLIFTSDATVSKALLSQDLIMAGMRFYPSAGSFFFQLGAGSGAVEGTLKVKSKSNSNTPINFTHWQSVTFGPPKESSLDLNGSDLTRFKAIHARKPTTPPVLLITTWMRPVISSTIKCKRSAKRVARIF